MRPCNRISAIAAVFSASFLGVAPTTTFAREPQIMEIEAQDLIAAIAILGAQADLQIISPAELLAGRTSVEVSGVLTPKEALAQMLSDNTLDVRELRDGTLVISENPEANFVTQNATSAAVLLDEILVQRELIERSLQDSQTSAVVVLGEQLSESAEKDIQTILNRTPGFTTAFGTNFAIRGIQINGVTNGGGGNTIFTTLDGALLSNLGDANVASFSTWDLGQVEVLRGPQSTQAGRNALAGTVNLTSNEPEFFREGRARIGFGNANTRQASLTLNTPILDDVLAFRIAVDYEETDGFVFNELLNADESARDQLTVRAALRYAPNPDLDVTFRYTFVDENGAGSPFAESSSFPDLVVDKNVPLVRNAELDSFALNGSYRLSDTLTLESETVSSKGQSFLQSDVDFTPNALARLTRTIDDETTTQDLRLKLNDGSLRATFGAYYYKQESFTDQIVDGIDPTTTFPGEIVSTTEAETENFALYGEAEFDPSDTWTFVGGLRYDRETQWRVRTETTTLSTPLGDVVIPGAGSDNKATYEALLPKLGAVYKFNENRSIGVQYQRGYRAGGSGTNNGVTPAVNYEFDPEFTDNVEVSYRSVSADGNLLFNANVFYTYWRDQQVVVQGATGLATDITVENAGESRLWGFETDLRYQATERLNVSFAAAYSRTEFLEFESGGVDLAGNSFIFAPELTATLGADYVFDNGLSIGGEVAFTGEAFSDVANTEALKNDAFTLVNLRASYDFGNGAQINAYVRNAFDEAYTVFQAAPLGTDDVRVNTGTPRELGIYLSYAF